MLHKSINEITTNKIFKVLNKNKIILDINQYHLIKELIYDNIIDKEQLKKIIIEGDYKFLSNLETSVDVKLDLLQIYIINCTDTKNYILAIIDYLELYYEPSIFAFSEIKNINYADLLSILRM